MLTCLQMRKDEQYMDLLPLKMSLRPLKSFEMDLSLFERWDHSELL